MAPAAAGKLLWVNKTPRSASLSHSEDSERLKLFCHAQRTSRLHKVKRRYGGKHGSGKGKKGSAAGSYSL